jgi:CubicO group peptidase (beta-lactamase class C family)
MRSGLQHIEVGHPVEHSDTNQVLFVGGTQDMAARAIAKPLEAKPGAKFEYSSLTTIILSEIITRTLTASHDPRVRAAAYRKFAEERLFKPAGVTSAFLEFDGSGTQIGGSLIYMTLDDWGRMGTLLIDGKAENGAQVIAPDWLAFMKAPSPLNPEYGAQVWLNRPGGRDPDGPTLFPGQAPDNVVSMVGHLGQYVLAGTGRDPHDAAVTHRIVLVRLGKTQDGPALEPVRRELGAIMGGLIE